MIGSGDLDFSFSGLKTAVLLLVRDSAPKAADVARAFEEAIVDVLVAKCALAIELTGLTRLVVAGGVGANRPLRNALAAAAKHRGFDVYFPEQELCTDNGAMIAFAAAARLRAGLPHDHAHSGFTVRPRWALDSLPPP
jgi:N6-L-threonylcarbamoyladenine synthase